MNAPFFRLTPTEEAVQKRDRARAALAARFEREAEAIPLTDWKARLKLSHVYQGHIDEIEKEYQRDMWRCLNRIGA